jgi:hypothetical protein
VLESVATGEDSSAVISRSRRMRDIPIVEPQLAKSERGWEIVL